MQALRVPKRKVMVRLLLADGGEREVAVFLAEFAERHAGPERMSDLLNAELPFFPATDPKTDAMLFLARSGVAAAVVQREIEPDDTSTLPTEQEVELLLLDGRKLSGLLSYVRPPDRSRVLDYLNDAPSFFPLILDSGVALINKTQVARVQQVR